MTTLEFDAKLIHEVRDLGPFLMDYLSILIPDAYPLTKEADAAFVFGYEHYRKLYHTPDEVIRIWVAEGVKQGWVPDMITGVKHLRRGANALSRYDYYPEGNRREPATRTFVRDIFNELYGHEPEETLSNPYIEKSE